MRIWVPKSPRFLSVRGYNLCIKLERGHTQASSRRPQAQKVLGTDTRALGSTLSPTGDFISKPSDSERPQAISAVLAILAFLAPGSPEEDPTAQRDQTRAQRGATRSPPAPTQPLAARSGRKLTRSQPDSSRRGGNPRSPRTGILRALPARPPRRGSEPQAAVAARTPPRGASPLSLLPRRSRPAPRLAAPTPAARPGKLQRPLPPSPPGDGSPAPRPRPRGGQRHAPGLPAGDRGPGAVGGPRLRASRRHPRLAVRMVRSTARLRARQVRPSARPGKCCALARLARGRRCPRGRAAS